MDHVAVTDVNNVGGTTYTIAYYGTADEHIVDECIDAEVLMEYLNGWDAIYS